MEQYQYSRIAWAGSLHPADSCSGCVGTAAGVSVQYYQWIIHAGGGAVYLKASGESSFSGLENVVSDADQTADISIAYDRISATASDRSGRDIEKCADPDGSIAGFFRAVHDYGTIWHQYGSGGAIGVYDNVV